MLVRKGLVAVLGGTLLFQVIAIAGVLRHDNTNTAGFARHYALNSDAELSRSLTAQKNKGNAIISDIRLNPPVPDQLPDLATGYIFNKERVLYNDQEMAQPEDNVNIDDVYYSGSIITQKKKIALVSYQEQAVNKRQSANVRRGQTQQAASRTVKRLEVNDSIGGYTVADIFPDKLVLMKQGKEKEKYLHDPDKPVVRLSKPPVNNVPGRISAERLRAARNKPQGLPAR